MRILACFSLCVGIGAGAAAWADTPDLPADPAAAGAAVLDSAAVADILREAGEGAALSEGAASAPAAPAPAASAPARPTTPPARPATQPAAAADDPFGLRPRVKEAWDWVKESVPWLDTPAEAEPERRPAPRAHPGWDAPGLHDPLDQRSAGSTGAAGWGGGHTGAAQAPPNALPEALQARSAATPVDSLFESIRAATAMIREAIAHPMSWLIAALVAAGAFAIKRFDRRPK